MSTRQATVQTVTLWRDKAGYEVKDYGPARTDVATLGPGKRIEGRSGEMVPVEYSIVDGKLGEPWRKASRNLRGVKTLDDLCAFMTQFGPIDKTGGMRPTGRQSLAEVFAMGYIRDIAALVAYCETDDSDGFLQALRGELTTGAVLRPVLGGLWVTELPSMLALFKYDMWSSFGESRAAPPARRKCEHCGKTMHVGGSRRQNSKPTTARFCSTSCRVGSHLRQKRYEARAV